MAIPEEILKSRSVVLYRDSDRSIINEVNIFNECMQNSRVKMKSIKELKIGFDLFNIAMPLIAAADAVFTKPLLAFILAGIYIVIYVIFISLKENRAVIAAALSLFVCLNWIFVFAIVIDVVLLKWIKKIDEPLKEIHGYPIFNDIKIRYSRSNKPIIADDDEDFY